MKRSGVMRKRINIFRIAARSLMQHKLRSFLSILGIVCGVMAVLSMISIGEGARQEVVRQIEQLGTRNIYIRADDLTVDQRQRAREHLSSGLTIQDRQRILAGCPNIRLVAALKDVRASVIATFKESSPQIVAVTANYIYSQNLQLLEGRFIGDLDPIRKNMVCVVGSDVAEGLGTSGKIGRQVRIEGHLFRIVGILDRFHIEKSKVSAITTRNYNEMIFIPLGTESGLVRSGTRESGMGGGELSEMVVQVFRTDQVLETAKIVDRIIQVSHHHVKDYQIVIPQELLRQAQETQRTFNVVLGAIAGVSLLVGGIGIMNIMLATVTERIREIGIRRAVGATRDNIVFQFLSEAVILTFSGGLIGVGLGLGAVAAITKLSGWSTSVTAWAFFLPLGMSVLVGVFFGLYPAIRAARMDPVAALRHE